MTESRDSHAKQSKPSVHIYYCPGCKWLARSSWMAQELLETFGADLESVCLHPAEKSGTFKVTVDGQLVWDRTVDMGFPQIKELKKRVRDVISPEKELGHLDR